MAKQVPDDSQDPNMEASMSDKDEIDFQFLAENSADIICRAGMDRILRYVSPSCFRVLGWKPEDLIGKGPDTFVLAEDFHIVETVVAQLLSPETESATGTTRVRKKDGLIVWVETNVRLVRDPATGEPTEYVYIMRDITERKRLEDKLSAMALTDSLTGLSNRRAFDRALNREWKRTLREGSQISLLLLDVDHFKEFNDQYGHQAGDDCLRAIAAAVGGGVRGTDMVARYGGEEITVILPSTDTADAVKVAEKVRLAVEGLRLPQEGHQGRDWVTVSVGVATALARQGGTIKMPESLLLAADNALYKAKHEGRNRVATALLVATKSSAAI
jgi:diguanylate cyclase (GGDEF)-like protein/PAS domain S-box-containing protein